MLVLKATSTRIRFHSAGFHIVSGNGAIVFYSLEDGEQYKNDRKTYTCERGLSRSICLRLDCIPLFCLLFVLMLMPLV